MESRVCSHLKSVPHNFLCQDFLFLFVFEIQLWSFSNLYSVCISKIMRQNSIRDRSCIWKTVTLTSYQMLNYVWMNEWMYFVPTSFRLWIRFLCCCCFLGGVDQSQNINRWQRLVNKTWWYDNRFWTPLCCCRFSCTHSKITFSLLFVAVVVYSIGGIKLTVTLILLASLLFLVNAQFKWQDMSTRIWEIKEKQFIPMCVYVYVCAKKDRKNERATNE